MRKAAPISHRSLIFFIVTILIAQDADTNMRAESEKFAEDLKFAGSFAQVPFTCVEMKHPKASVCLISSPKPSDSASCLGHLGQKDPGWLSL